MTGSRTRPALRHHPPEPGDDDHPHSVTTHRGTPRRSHLPARHHQHRQEPQTTTLTDPNPSMETHRGAIRSQPGQVVGKRVLPTTTTDP
jgi:hypothetical protein